MNDTCHMSEIEMQGTKQQAKARNPEVMRRLRQHGKINYAPDYLPPSASALVKPRAERG